MGTKSLGNTKWYESSLIKFHSSQSNFFLQTLQLQQTLFSSFQCGNNEVWHWHSLPNTAHWASFRTGENKVALVQCYAPKMQPAETAVCVSHTVMRSQCLVTTSRTKLCRAANPQDSPFLAELTWGFCTALQHYHRRALKHCLSIIQKYNQYFKDLKDRHKTFSLLVCLFPVFHVHIKKNYPGLQVHNFLQPVNKELESWETMSHAILLFTREKSCQDTSVILI